MKEKEIWATDYLIRKSGNFYHGHVGSNVAYQRDVKIWIDGFERAREKMIEMLSMPAGEGLKSIFELGEKDV